MPSKRRKRAVEPLTCRRNWRICSTAKTEARARMLHPFQQPSCALQFRFEKLADENEGNHDDPTTGCSRRRFAPPLNRTVGCPLPEIVSVRLGSIAPANGRSQRFRSTRFQLRTVAEPGGTSRRVVRRHPGAGMPQNVGNRLFPNLSLTQSYANGVA